MNSIAPDKVSNGWAAEVPAPLTPEQRQQLHSLRGNLNQKIFCGPDVLDMIGRIIGEEPMERIALQVLEISPHKNMSDLMTSNQAEVLVNDILEATLKSVAEKKTHVPNGVGRR